MSPLLRLGSTRIALLVAALVGAGLCASPLLGVLGVESALALGLLLPPFVAAAAARSVVHARAAKTLLGARQLVSRPLGLAVLVVGVPTLLLGLNALRVRTCEPALGLAFLLLGPLLGCAAAAITGALLAAWLGRPRLATTLAALLPVFAVALGIHTFWSSPAIFVYGHFAGWFPGTIYDEGVRIPGSYLTFRATTAMGVSGLALLAVASADPTSGRPTLTRLLRAWPRSLLAILLLSGFAAAELYSDELGHTTSSAFIAEELGTTAWGRRCVVHAPRELGRRELRQLVRDCDYRVEQSEVELGVHQEKRLRAFFFRSPDEKRMFMGAARTFVAKPWRDEVYLQLRGWPHPVLHHEIVHVVAGNTAAGPFRVAGRWGGWLPDPALIEGVAVAAAWSGRDGLTPHQWARAMLELEMMPPLDQVVGLSFLGQPARNAYTIAGSFIRWLLDTRGAAIVREAYRTGDVPAATGSSWAELEHTWRAYLREQPLPEEALALAELRFSERSIFSAVCPHLVARLAEQLGGDLAAGDDARALETCREMLDIDAGDVVTRAQYAGALARSGQAQEAVTQLGRLTGEPPAPEPVVALARQNMADAAWRNGEAAEALAVYRELLSGPQWEESARALEVRVMGLEAGGRQARLVFEILVGRDGAPASAPVTVHFARELARVRPDGLGPYLEARQMLFASRDDRALPLVHEARERGLATPRLRHEARRMEGQALFALGRLDDAETLWREVRDDPESSEADRVAAGDWLGRIGWARP